MRASLPLIFVPAAALLCTGCNRTPKERLQGKWLGESVENVTPGAVAKATGWVKGTAIEFSGNKVTVTIPAETPRTGTYRVASVQGDRVTVSFIRAEGGHDEAVFRFVDDRTLRWVTDGGAEIVMTKAK